MLKYDMEKDGDLVLLHDASETAATIPGANHLTDQGRGRLFEGQYRPLWGKKSPVAADAFLAGRAEFSKDLRTITVNVAAFGRDGNVEKVAVLTARPDLNTLVEAGESFNLRALVRGDGTVEETKVVEDDLPALAEKTKQGEEDNKLVKEDQAVALEIHYVDRATRADRVVPVTVEKGEARAEEPTEAQDVYFRLVRKDPSKARYGVVLMVNGVNTLYEERRPPKDCTKWIIDPGAPPFVIEGFRLKEDGEERIAKFVIRSQAESALPAARYGADTGTISFSVFKEQPEAENKAGLNGEAEKRAEVAVSNPPPDLPKDGGPAQLPPDAGPVKAKAEKNAAKLLGIFEKGGLAYDSSVEHASFTNPILVQTVTIRYYKPGKR
jgi:hypothetical protein